MTSYTQPIIMQSIVYEMMSRTPANIVICFLGHAYGAPATNIKMERRRWQEKPLIVGRSGTQNIVWVTKLRSSCCGAHLMQSYCKESNISDKNWLLLRILKLQCHWNERRLKIVNSIFLLIHTSFLFLKMAYITKLPSQK